MSINGFHDGVAGFQARDATAPTCCRGLARKVGLCSIGIMRDKPTRRCRDCDKYESQHNFCRMCGFEFRPGYARRVKSAAAYHVNEKYCGNCGEPIKECKC